MKRLAVLTVVVLLASAAPVAAQNAIKDDLAETAQEMESLREQMNAAQGDVGDWQNRIAATTSRMNQILAELDAAEAVLADLDLAILETESAISFTEFEISQKEAELVLTSTNISNTHNTVVTQAVELFKRGGGQIQAAFDYESVQDAAVAVRYGSAVIQETNRALDSLEELRSQKEQQVALVEEQKATLNGHLDRLDGAQQEAELQRSIVEESRKQAEGELVNQKALLQAVRNEIAHFESELDALEAEQGRLLELLAREQSRGGIAPGELWPPVDGPIVSGYGLRLHPILGYSRMHTGLDIDGDSGDEIVAAAGGTVIYSGYRGGYGNTVIIDHGGGMATLYAHQSKLVATNGQKVAVADLIGYVGSTGLSTGPHLHFEVRLSGAHTDPAPYFS